MCNACNRTAWIDAAAHPVVFVERLPAERRRRCEIAYRLLAGCVTENGVRGGLHIQLDDDNYDFDYNPAYGSDEWHAGPSLLAERVAGAAWNGLTVLERALVVAWVWNYWAELPRPVSPLATGIPRPGTGCRLSGGLG